MPQRENDGPEIRGSQTVVPFGVGGLYEWRGESFIACDTRMWKKGHFLIGKPLKNIPRLAKALGVSEFRQAPERERFLASDGDHGVPYMRFPEWNFCSNSSCRKMTKLNQQYSRTRPKCDCAQSRRFKKPLTPMRFVQVCEDGHISDVDWWWWAHSMSGSDCKDRVEKLRFKSDTGAGAGLGGLYVEASCGAKRSLEGILRKDALERIKSRCEGRQPWRLERGDCDKHPRVVHKGGSNVYYPIIKSALSIPPDSCLNPENEDEAITNDEDFIRVVDDLNAFSEGRISGGARIRLRVVANNFPDSDFAHLEELALRAWSQRHGNAHTTAVIDIDYDEFLAFSQGWESTDEEGNDFLTKETTLLPEGQVPSSMAAGELDIRIEKVVLAKKLREIRALTGFTRLLPDGPESDRVVRPDLDRFKGKPPFLPATENYGEGIFVQFTEKHLERWESNEAVIQRVNLTQEKAENLGFNWLPEVTPRFIALHTLSHLLIRQLTFECGYSSSALRERIYARTTDKGKPMAAILIYTASGDSQGSLGGLVRQGESPRLLKTIGATLTSASWCSADPVCSEVESGTEGLNQGACYACSLISETSCTTNNLLLDRTLVIGNDDIGVPGFLKLPDFYESML